MSTQRGLIRSAGTIGLLTGVSRILGFIRDLVIATAFGTGVAAEAFVVSFKLPNLLRDLVGEGAANAAFVPVLTEVHERRRETFWRVVSSLLVAMGLILIALSVLGVLFAPAVVRLIAPGFAASTDPDKFPLTVRLTRVIFPYVALIGLSALAMGVLNSLREFKSSAVGPILLNLAMIVAGVFFESTYGPMALVVAVLVGGVLQVSCQIPALMKHGFRFHKPDFKNPDLMRVGKLLIPRAFGSALYQINVFVDSILASFESIVGAGGQSALYYSNRLFQLPLAIFGVALAQAALPTFSAQHARGDTKALKQMLSGALHSLFFVSLPSAVGLAVLAEPIVRIVFEHGRFDAYSTGITSSALFFYAWGLVSCCFIKLYVNAFYAMQDTRTPVRTMLVSVALNVGLSLILMRPLGIGGLALASSISATVNLALLARKLNARIGPLDAPVSGAFIRMGVAVLGLALVAAGLSRIWLARGSGQSTLVQAFLLALTIALAGGTYFGLSHLLRRKVASQ